MPITHIFFDLHHVLIDSKKMAQNYRRGLGQAMAERYGKTPAIWEAAQQCIVADWDSYFADLNLSGDDMMRDLKEGWFRVTRALFRLAEVAEPSSGEISALSLELPSLAPACGDAMYPDARCTVKHLHKKDYQVGIVTHMLAGQAEAVLRGADMLDYFTAPIMGVDTVGQFDKDKLFFIKVAYFAQVDPSHCLVVDGDVSAIASAKSAGMDAIYFLRDFGDPEQADLCSISACLSTIGVHAG